MPNSAVKRLRADGSVGFPHVRVGRRQASNDGSGPGYPVRGFSLVGFR